MRFGAAECWAVAGSCLNSLVDVVVQAVVCIGVVVVVGG